MVLKLVECVLWLQTSVWFATRPYKFGPFGTNLVQITFPPTLGCIERSGGRGGLGSTGQLVGWCRGGATLIPPPQGDPSPLQPSARPSRSSRPILAPIRQPPPPAGPTTPATA